MPLEPISNAVVTRNLVYLHHRANPDQPVFWDVPAKRIFMLTDLVVQNRGPGDTPVEAAAYTRFSISAPGESDAFFTVVGNMTLSEHFTTALPITGKFRFYNFNGSTAPFVEFVITGYLLD